MLSEATGSVQSADELQAKYGDTVEQLAHVRISAYKLGGVFRELDKPIYTSDGILIIESHWFQKYGSNDHRITGSGKPLYMGTG